MTKRIKGTILLLAALLFVLVSGAVTAYAVTGETGQALSRETKAPASFKEYEEEELAVETYYLDQERLEDTEML